LLGEGDESSGYLWKVKVYDTDTHNDDAAANCRPDIEHNFNQLTSSNLQFNKIIKKVSTRRPVGPSKTISQCTCRGRYEIKRTHTLSNITKKWSVLFVAEEQTPYHFFSKEVIRKLIKYQYYYVHMSHYFQSSDSFLPHVSKFFRGYADRALELAQKTIKYTIEKKETLALMHGVRHDARMDQEGTPKANHFLHDIFHTSHDGGSIFPIPMKFDGFFTFDANKQSGGVEQAFDQAFHWEKVLMAELSRAIKKATSICDSELEEYISAELMPGQRTTMKLFADYKKTMENMRKADNSPANIALTEFIFDSEM